MTFVQYRHQIRLSQFAGFVIQKFFISLKNSYIITKTKLEDLKCCLELATL